MRKNLLTKLAVLMITVATMATPAYALPTTSAYTPVSSTPTMLVDDVFGTGMDTCSWYSDTTGCYITPFYEPDYDTYYIWFTSENDTMWAHTKWTVVVTEFEHTPNGGLVCRGDMYEAVKESPAYNGRLEVTWDSLETIDFPKMEMIDGHQLTDVDMVADDYQYYGPTGVDYDLSLIHI